MKYLALLILITAFPAHAERSRFSFIFENDFPLLSLAGGDDNYTNGLGIYYALRSDNIARGLREAAQALALERSSMLASALTFGAGQLMYTPTDLSATEIDVNDRPYGGWLYASLGTEFRTLRTSQSFGLQIGVVGPASLAGLVQRSFHGALGMVHPYGWPNQLHNELGVNLIYEQRARIFEAWTRGARIFDFAPSVTLSAGNVYTFGALGARMRFGTSLGDDFGPPALHPVAAYAPLAYESAAGDGPAGWRLNGFAGFEARYFARDIFLDGNTFRDSPRVRKRPLQAQWEAGLEARHENFTLQWRVARSTPAFVGATRPHYVGMLQAAYTLN